MNFAEKNFRWFAEKTQNLLKINPRKNLSHEN